MRSLAILALALLLPLACPVRAQSPSATRPEAFSKLVNCRTVADPIERLSCYDRELAAVDAAEKRRELVVTDRARVRETRRGLFGFTLPKLGLLGGDEDEVEEIEAAALSASYNRDGGWTVRLAQGGTWTQTDGRPLALRPREGSKIRIRKGVLGSYMMSVDGQPGIRVRRVS